MSATAASPTQGHPGVGAASMGNHPMLNKQILSQAYAKFKELKDKGVPETDPELAKAKKVLQMASYQAQMEKSRKEAQAAAAAQQQGQHPPQIQTPSHGQQPNLKPNETNGTPTQANGLGSPTEGTPMQGNPSQVVLPGEKGQLLKMQMAAYRLLMKNAPLPGELQRVVFPSHTPQKPPTPKQSLDAASTALSDATSSANQIPPKRRFETFVSPYQDLYKGISYADHAKRKYREQIPSIMPVGVDAERARAERENIIYNRILTRKQELEKLHPGIAVWNTAKSDTPVPDDSIKRKAFIEYKKLCLLPKQRALRQEVSKVILGFDSLAMTANRSMYRRQKKHLLREARFTEKLEKEQRDAREHKEKQRHNDYMQAILDHANEVARNARDQRARTQRLGRLMTTQHQIIEKEEQKRIERTAKQRLQALKANDEETYLKLLGQAKDSRITHLLKQTDSFLGELAASVKDQQRSQDKLGRRDSTVPSESSDEDIGDDEDEDGGKKVDYYEVAHRIKEEVYQQSSNLVGGSLKEYQLKGLQWMISLYNNNLNGILADEMGLGKTIQTISLITYLIEKKKQDGPYLVIVPLSTLTNWNNEFEKWAPSVKRIVYKGPPNTRKQAAFQIRSGQFQVLLTTYEYIIKDRPLLSKVKWLHMVVDEGHRMKNAQSKLSSTITQYYHTRYRLILTGTPLQNNLPELWALLNFVLPNIFKSVKSFDEWFNTPFANTGGQDKMDLTEEEQLLVIKRLHKVLRPFLLRRLKKDVEKDLPDKQERVIKCNMSSLQLKLYNQLLTQNKLVVSDGKGGKTGLRGLSNMLMQLRKLCNHPFVFEEVEDQMNPDRVNNDLLWRTAGKFELLDRVLPKLFATGHRVLMFFQMTQIMNIMEDFMRLRGYEYLRLDGATKADDRSDLLKRFNAEGSNIFCFLLSTRAGGLGLNLQTADTVIIYDSDWNPHQDLQAQDRAHRIGQKNEVRILRLITSKSVEEKILERAQFKLDMDGKVIQAGKFDNKSTNEERDAMLKVMLESAADAENLEEVEMDDDDLNMLMMRNEEEIEVFQKIDAEREKNSPYGPNKKLGRLLGESELPDIWVANDNVPEEQEDIYYGRGARERTKVKYDDGLTEEQWLAAVDDDEDTIEDAVRRKEERKARKIAKHDAQDGVDSPAPVEESPKPVTRESSEEPVPKKRGRKPKLEKRKIDEISMDGEAITPQPAAKRGRRAKVEESLASEEREALQKVANSLFDTLFELKAPPLEPGDGVDPEDPAAKEERSVIPPFQTKVPKRDFPEYYYIIKDPIAMDDIEKKMDRKTYQSLNEFANDLQLMFDNCRMYNEDGSWLYKDADLLEKTFYEALRRQNAEHKDALGKAAWRDPQDSNNATSNATSERTPSIPNGTSSTPSAPHGGTKLKLNFSASSAS